MLWVTRNIKAAEFRGVELDVSGVGPWEARWDAGVSVLDVDPEGAAGFFSKRALRPETRRLTLGFSRGLGDRAGASLHGLYAGRRSEGPYHQVDMRLWASVASGSLYLDLLNLSNQDYLDASGQPIAGVGVLIGYRLGR